MQEPNFQKHPDGLLPCVVQDVDSKEVLMLGYMNAESFKQSLDTKKVTFFSRSKQRLWTKGEQSGHTLWLKDIKVDCDQDTVLVMAQASGPVCHKQTRTCFTQDHDLQDPYGFLYQLEGIQAQRIQSQDQESYTRALWEEGLDRISQKVGEEAIELVIASKNKDSKEVKNEAADLLYHFLLLLKTQNLTLQDVETVLMNRSKKSRST